MKAVLIGGSYKEIEIAKEIVEFIKINQTTEKIISFIAADFEDFDANKNFSNKLINLFEQQSLFFEKIHIIDSLKSKSEMISNLKESNIIFLLGGDTLKQIDYINKFSLKKYIKMNDKIIIGISAGAINLSDRVVLAKDEDDNIPKLSIYDGLGITNINIEPHCDFKNAKHFVELEEASLYSPIILMNEDCFIIVNDDEYKYFGSYVILDKKNLFYNNKKCTLSFFLKEIDYD